MHDMNVFGFFPDRLSVGWNGRFSHRKEIVLLVGSVC
jgi:hypothetical protein